jgi:hypothetical protein
MASLWHNLIWCSFNLLAERPSLRQQGPLVLRRPRATRANPSSLASPSPLSPPLLAAAGVSRREKPARCRWRGAVLYLARGGPCGAVPSPAAVMLGRGRRGLAWRLPVDCARGDLPQWRRRQVVVLAVAERQRSLPTPALKSDEGSRRAGWPCGSRCGRSWRWRPTTHSPPGGALSRARSGSTAGQRAGGG